MNKISLLDDASLPSNIEELEKEVQEVLLRQKLCQEKALELMAKEDPKNGIFYAKDINEAKQIKMLLQYQLDLRKAKINRLRMGT